MPFVLFLLGAAAVGLVAASASAKGRKSGVEGGRTYTLDANLPAQLRQQVLTALAREKDGAKLLTFAGQCATAGYPLAAAALTQRAVELGAVPHLPYPPQPVPLPPQVQPTPPAHPTSPPPAPPPAPPTSTHPAPEPGHVNPIDPFELPEPARTQVLTALGPTMTEPAALEALAKHMDAQGYTYAAQALRTKIAILRVSPPPVQLPFPPLPPWSPPEATPAPPVHPAPPAPTSSSAPPVHPAPLPPQPPQATPPASPFTLDTGMPPAMQSAVLGALTTEQEPNKLQAFAQEIQGTYPIAAGLLMAKANALRVASQVPTQLPSLPLPHPTSTSPSPAPTPTSHGEGPAPSALPIGDESTRTGRNAGRPTGYPFIHLHGESTYPAKIAQEATGSGASFTELSHINPQFSKDGVHWINIQTGDAINVPWTWVPKLVGRYKLEVDPGIAAPVSAAALPASIAHALPPGVSTALALAKGGSNGLASHA